MQCSAAGTPELKKDSISLLFHLDHNFPCMLARFQIVESVLGRAEWKHAVKCWAELDFPFFEKAIHVFEIRLRSHYDAPVKALTVCIQYFAFKGVQRDILQLSRFCYQLHQSFRIPVCVEAFQAAYERDGTATTAEKANVFEYGLRARIVDHEIYAPSIRETFDLVALVRGSLVVDTTDFWMQFLKSFSAFRRKMK
jgi:hypothetical protein